VTVPDSGCGKLRVPNPRTTQVTTAGAARVDPPLLDLETAPLASIAKWTTTVPESLGSLRSPIS
jgi:hypothetical protein